MKYLLLMTMMILPALAVAQPTPIAEIVDLFCDEIPGTSNLYRLHFSILNNSQTDDLGICDLHFVSTVQPPVCDPLDCASPAGWSCFLNPFGGADWFANTPTDCVAVGETKPGFSILMDAAACDLQIQFTNGIGAVVLETEALIDCLPIGVQVSSWGTIKSLYR